MKNISKLKRIILALGIIFALSTISNYNILDEQGENEGTIENQNGYYLKKPKLSGIYTEPFIHIDDNWTATLAEPWCNLVNGIYVIENVTIDASSSPTGSGIFINNSKTNYFIIRNCTIFNAKSGGYDGGIKLENTNNGTLSNNNCSNNIRTGILLVNSDNNIISGNTVNYNGWLGIYLIECKNSDILGNIVNENGEGIRLNTQCHNNTIEGNTANDNTATGIFLMNNCDDNNISENIASNNITTEQNYGIYLNNECDNNIISGNTANINLEYGIWLNDHCDNNTISGNTANDNTERGIYLYNTCNNNIITGNIANNNTIHGIYISSYCNNNIISGNIANDNSMHGIVLYTYSNNNTISGNTANGNMQYGIFLFTNCNNNRISGNTANSNRKYGIHLTSSSNNNTISGNMANYNDDYGIFLKMYCYNNTISENIIFENSVGIQIENDCSDNLLYYNCLSYNSMNNSVDDGTNYWDNGIFGNYWSNYTGIDANLDGIGDSPHDIPGKGGRKDNKPLMNYDPIYIETPEDMSYEIGTIGNILKWTVFDVSPFLESYNILMDGNSIKSGTLYDTESEIFVNIDGLDDDTYMFTLEIDHGYGAPASKRVWVTVINTAPEYTVKPDDISYEVGSTGKSLSWNFSDVSTNNPTFTIFRDSLPLIIDHECISGEIIEIPVDGLTIGSYCYYIEINDGYDEIVQDSAWVKVVNTLPVFTLKPNDTSYEVGSTGNSLSWTFSDVSTNNPTYTITRNSLPLIIDAPCISGEAINISADELEAGSYCFEIEINDGYDGTIKDATWVTVKSSMGLNLLYVEIFEQSFSENEFNVTFVVYNESSQGIDTATIQMWWNGTEVSDNVTNLGNGLYFVSLEPITVAPGDDPILLNMVISDSGYEDRHFETYLAVDPEILEKRVEKDGDEFPFMITIITILSAAGGIGATIITLGILHKRKGISEVT